MCPSLGYALYGRKGEAVLQQEHMRNRNPKRLGVSKPRLPFPVALCFSPQLFTPYLYTAPRYNQGVGGGCRHAVEIRYSSILEPQAFNISNIAKNKPLFLPLPLILEAPRQHPKITKYGPWTQIPETLCASFKTHSLWVFKCQQP